jgi:hypothetical protein
LTGDFVNRAPKSARPSRSICRVNIRAAQDPFVRPRVIRSRPSARHRLIIRPSVRAYRDKSSLVRPRVSVKACDFVRPRVILISTFVRPRPRGLATLYICFVFGNTRIVFTTKITFSSLGDLIPRPRYPFDHRPCAEKVRSLQASEALGGPGSQGFHPRHYPAHLHSTRLSELASCSRGTFDPNGSQAHSAAA